MTSYKLQATSYKLQGTSYKLQATSYKLQATSDRLPAPIGAWFGTAAALLTRESAATVLREFDSRKLGNNDCDLIYK